MADSKVEELVEELITKAGVRDVDQECLGEDLLALTNFCDCDAWQPIGEHLHLSKPLLSRIDNNYKQDVSKQLVVLQCWKKEHSSNATYRVLVRALASCQKVDAALKVCKFLAKKESKNNPVV